MAGAGEELRLTPGTLTRTPNRGNLVWQEGVGEGGELLGAGGVEESVEQLVVLACQHLDIHI